MKKHIFYAAICICFISTISKGQSPNFSVDMLQNMLFGVSTLKGVKEIYPQVIIKAREGNSEDASSFFQIDSLDSKNLEQEIIETLTKAGFTIVDGLGDYNDNERVYLNVSIMIRTDNRQNPTYSAFVTTEAYQYLKLARDEAIHTLNRTWPIFPPEYRTRNVFLLKTDTIEKAIKDEVNNQVNYFVNDLLAANPKPVTRSAVDVDIEALRKTLLEENIESRYGLRVKDTDPGLQAIQKLESAGSQEAVNILLEFLTNNRMDRKLKQHALIALGRIGTVPAIEAIKKFEAWSQKRYANPLPFYMGSQEYAIDHYAASEVQPLAQVKDKTNKTWALVPLNRFYKTELCLTSLIENDQWSEPILLNLPGLPEPKRLSETTFDAKYQLQVDGESIKIICNDKTYETTISEQTKDTDKDGLTDTLEARMSTDPNKSDSDGDGVLDGKDSNPLTPKHKDINDVTEIRQAVFSALFATTRSRNIIIIVDRDEFAKQEYYGYSGPAIRIAEHIEGIVNVTSIDIKYQSEDAATVDISDHEASEAASGHEAKLKKINGKWVVIDFKMTWIS